MNIIKFLDSISTDHFSAEEQGVFSSRREAFKKLGGVSKKMALAAIPTAIFAAIPKMAKAQEMPSIIEVLNYALTLEHLESKFYRMGSESGIYAENAAIFDTIRDHEVAHVQFLQEVINSLQGTPVAEPAFDFTVGGAFDPFNDYPTFLALSQAFEDTGVRAYKGQAANVMSEDGILTPALQIHSVEARHASQVRRLRGQKGWIVLNNIDGGMPDATQAVYDAGTPPEEFPSEANLVQGGVNLGDALSDFTAESISESFDEPLDMATVNSIASLFIVQ